MSKKTLYSCLVTFTLLVLMLAFGAVTAIIWNETKEDSSEINYDANFGELPSAIIQTQTRNIDITNPETYFELHNQEVVNIYKIDRQHDFYPTEELSDEVATTFYMDQTNSTNNSASYTNFQSNSTMEFNNSSATISINFFPTPDDEENPDFTEATAIAEAQYFLEEHNLWPYEAGKTETSIRYYIDISFNYYEINSKNEATLFGVNFTENIDGIPKRSSRLNSGEIEVLFDSNNNIFKVNYMYRPVKQEIAIYPLKNKDRLYSDVQSSRKGEVIIPFEGKIPTSINLEEISLAYRISDKNIEYLLPIIIFEGIDNNSQLTSILINAVSENYISY